MHQSGWLLAVLIPILASCSSPDKQDKSIKADLTVKAEKKQDFAGVIFTVEKGIVTLSGQCPTDKSKTSVEGTVKKLYGVKDVVNNITIAPVVIGTDQGLKHQVDSVLKKYAGVQALTRDSIVHLEGKVKQDELPQLTAAINSLSPRQIDSKVSVE
jgi:osmotically-inducible protein OsmY